MDPTDLFGKTSFRENVENEFSPIFLLVYLLHRERKDHPLPPVVCSSTYPAFEKKYISHQLDISSWISLFFVLLDVKILESDTFSVVQIYLVVVFS